MIGELPQGVEPARDLWPGVRAAVVAARARRRVLGAGAFALVASLAVVVAVTAPREPDALRRFDELARQYDATRRSLDAILVDLATWVDEESIRETRNDLEILDQGIRSTRQALGRDPRNAGLALDLADRYLRDRGLLEDTARFLSRYAGRSDKGG